MKKQILSLFAGIAITAGLSAQAYIPNAGFETWGSSIGEPQEPTGWISLNLFASALFNAANPTFVSAAGTPDNYQGTYSCKIQTKTLVQNPDSNNIPWTSGYCMAGSFTLASPYFRPGYITQQRPQTFTYYEKYTPSGVDTAIAIVALTHWNTTTLIRDTIGIGYDFISAANSAYQMRTLTMTYLSPNAPDTCTIVFSSSGFNSPQVGSTLYVDALAFQGFVGIEESTADHSVDVYPNPSNNITYFDVTENDAAQIVVFDMTGREAKRITINSKHAELNSYELPVGVYTYTVISKEGVIQHRGKFSVSE